MKGQWNLIIGIIIAIIIAVFAVINVEPVEVNYIFGQNEWPLVLIILGSVLMGGVIVGSVGMYKIYQLQQELKQVRKKLETSSINDNKNTKETPGNEDKQLGNNSKKDLKKQDYN
ncbi:putative integral membrane protein [Evansella vedderi]|uniref:Integral membrane protein n=1 Tax=Evansella vedderi TaxID=38282 RepID=A0ABT9ZSQ9_9BACI|nr:lipopolysaccharide assembly protein LapA domain-containing protein [Evansella vedderi]MDQ0254257.1 putative integral membrane protein [Evansella vedderi]